MHFYYDPVGQAIVGGLCLVMLAFFLVAEWLDRRTEPPIMRQRINEGSDDYLAGRKSTLEAALDAAQDVWEPPT